MPKSEIMKTRHFMSDVLSHRGGFLRDSLSRCPLLCPCPGPATARYTQIAKCFRQREIAPSTTQIIYPAEHRTPTQRDTPISIGIERCSSLLCDRGQVGTTLPNKIESDLIQLRG